MAQAERSPDPLRERILSDFSTTVRGPRMVTRGRLGSPVGVGGGSGRVRLRDAERKRGG